VHQGGFIMFIPMVQELFEFLIFFVSENFIRSINFLGKLVCAYDILGKPLMSRFLMEVFWYILGQRCERY